MAPFLWLTPFAIDHSIIRWLFSGSDELSAHADLLGSLLDKQTAYF